MGSSLFLSMVTPLLFLLSRFHLVITVSPLPSPSSNHPPLCQDDESLALLQFKQSFLIDKNASGNPSAYAKTASWNSLNMSAGSSDCCSWDGVECDDNTGHVIGLDLGSSFLYGSINSSSTLFHLVHLQKLNLADNNFNYSQIPSRIGRLSRLTYLDLSASAFSGQIPSKISELSKLVSLDLSGNEGLLKLKKPGLNSLLQNLTNLKELHLSQVNISSTIPHVLANFSSLTSLLLRDCGLHGEFPGGIFQLLHLEALSVRFNPYLTGYFPEFNKSSPLKLLKVRGTSFSGELPNSIGDLNSLNELDISECNFSGSVPSSLGNLTQLTALDLSYNNFNRGTLAWLGKQTKLTDLSLAETNLTGNIPSSLGNFTQLSILFLPFNQLTGQIPSSLGNLTQLTELQLSANELHGPIPSSLGNLTQLTELQLSANELHGPIPQSIFTLVNLEILFLSSNNLSGIVEFDMFHKLKNLVGLQLSGNNLSLLTNSTLTNKFKLLGLAACNLREFPVFLQRQDKMEFLTLSENRIQGQIPKWMWNVGKETLWLMDLSYNFLTGFEQPPDVILPWTSLHVLHLHHNILQGLLPIPPPSIFSYSVSNNLLSGEISPLICDLSSLKELDLSNNNLGGILPQCLGNFSDSLLVLNLRNNKFHGTVPQIYSEGSNLRMIDLNQNQLQGLVPRSLSNCKMLEILDLGNNQINDTFPSWLGTLPKLGVLILRSNELHGAIKSPKTTIEFPELRIIDLSYNSFIGKLPFEYFKIWNAMKVVDVDHFRYMQANTSFHIPNYFLFSRYSYSMQLANKGMEISYTRIPEILAGIDLSNNRFEGGIPNSIGNLTGLQLLNFSNNILSGRIPSCLGDLIKLEALDLSQNKLSGEIPLQLAGLNFLEFFNISHNHLTGPIPHGKQFDTFEHNSFEGNSGLCGIPLSLKCEKVEAPVPPTILPPSTSEEGKESGFPSGYDWIFIAAGYGSGLVVGLVIGNTMTARKHKWFVETFGRWSPKGKGRKRGPRRGRTAT